MIKYIGSKRLLVQQIVGLIARLPDVHRVVDAFSGTARVSHALKAAGYDVTANDHNTYAYKLAQCYVQADRRRWSDEAATLIEEFNRIEGRPGYFTRTFCEDSRYLKPKNGARVDAIRDEIERRQFDPELEAVLLVSLMEAADRVDSTCGLQMAYLKKWAPRASNDLELRLPAMLDGAGAATCLDALQCVTDHECDVLYLDPPYNQHKYMNNYHVWESLVRWDKPDVYGIACKREDCREYDSAFNSKPRIGPALKTLVEAARSRYLLVSFNNEGYLSESDIRDILDPRGRVHVLSVDYKRYVGAQIGIYNPSGVKTGSVSHLRNRELLFLVDCCGDARLDLQFSA